MKQILLLIISLVLHTMSHAQQVLPLYAGAIPNSKPGVDKETSTIDTPWNILIIHDVSRPTLTVYQPANNTAGGRAVLIVPGGGYGIVAAGHEGADVAKKFVEAGITAFVLKYRIPDDATMVNKEIGPLQDAQRAMQLIRERAAEFKIDPKKVGIMGFSAGGHLAASEGTHYTKSLIENKQHTNLRPDFMILVYPVISFTDSIGHIGSRDNLLGKTPSKEKIEYYSNELRVNAQTPPTYLVHAKDDDVVKVENSIDFYAALKKNKVECQIYLYEKGGHGFGLKNETSEVKWIDGVIGWVKSIGLR